MTRLLTILALLLPLSAHAREFRVRHCPDPADHDTWEIPGTKYVCGVMSKNVAEAIARQLRDEERNRPPAPQVVEPVQVVEWP